MHSNPITVVDYDPRWPDLFTFLQKRVAGALGELDAAIEHVGSTAVPGLAAKPVIDIDVLLASPDALPAAIERLASLGYAHQGDLGIPGREAFLTPENDPPHHLYVCPPASLAFRRHVAFRDYLRSHPEEAGAYGELKRTLALRFRSDIEAYVAGKTEFVTECVRRALVASGG
jgi:GrpB-like predicted nucleotidyltransferase (UPF0157 family)